MGTGAWAVPEGTWTVLRAWVHLREVPGALPGSEDSGRGNLRFLTGSGLSQGSQGAPQDPAGPGPGLCLGAVLEALSEGTWGPAGSAAGSRLCQKEPGISPGGLGSCPGSGPARPGWESLEAEGSGWAGPL